MASRGSVTFVLASYNRRDVLLSTLQNLHGERRPDCPFETIVVDNASIDGTVDAVHAAFPHVHLFKLSRNMGACAKAYGVDWAVSEYVVFLDDDSYPAVGAVDRMIRRFECEPRLGAANFRAILPDGREECSALPNVFIGCGVGFRTEALRDVGGLDRRLFMAAEEYDLSFRLVNAGWQVRTFEDLCVNHLKSPHGRRSARPVYYDTRNNLLVASRYLPPPWFEPIARDWMQRYAWLSAIDHERRAHWRGLAAGAWRGWKDRKKYEDRRLRTEAFETLFRFGEIARRFERLASDGVERVLLADLGKNILPFVNGARDAGIQIAAIADDRFAAPGRAYRDVPVVTVETALRDRSDAVIVSNTSPVHARLTRLDFEQRVAVPVLAWYGAGADSSLWHRRPAAFVEADETEPVRV